MYQYMTLNEFRHLTSIKIGYMTSNRFSLLDKRSLSNSGHLKKFDKMETPLSTDARPNRSRHLSTVKDRRQLSCKDPHIQQRPYPTLKSLVLKAEWTQ